MWRDADECMPFITRMTITIWSVSWPLRTWKWLQFFRCRHLPQKSHKIKLKIRSLFKAMIACNYWWYSSRVRDRDNSPALGEAITWRVRGRVSKGYTGRTSSVTGYQASNRSRTNSDIAQLTGVSLHPRWSEETTMAGPWANPKGVRTRNPQSMLYARDPTTYEGWFMTNVHGQ